MNEKRDYKDMDGNKRSLIWMIKNEPGWARSVFTLHERKHEALEKAFEELEEWFKERFLQLEKTRSTVKKGHHQREWFDGIRCAYREFERKIQELKEGVEG